MTLRELSQLYWLTREIENERNRLRELESRALGIGSSVGDGMPGGSEPGRRTEQYAAAIADCKRVIEENLIRREKERAKLERYIDGIDDSLTREIYRLRFIDGLSWAKVAAAIGGANTEDSVRMACYRRLKEHEED